MPFLRSSTGRRTASYTRYAFAGAVKARIWFVILVRLYRKATTLLEARHVLGVEVARELRHRRRWPACAQRRSPQSPSRRLFLGLQRPRPRVDGRAPVGSVERDLGITNGFGLRCTTPNPRVNILCSCSVGGQACGQVSLRITSWNITGCPQEVLAHRYRNLL